MSSIISLCRPGRLLLAATSVALAMSLTACFTLVNGRNYGVGMETNRANVVVYKAATKALFDLGRAKGSARSRQAIVDVVPARLPITAVQRAAMCVLSLAFCLSADQIGRTLVSWFKSDIRTRSDFWEALSFAGQNNRCFAWTFLPGRNLTHKGTGTAGCRTGYVV